MNKAKLEYAMAIKNINYKKLCSLIGVSRSAMYRKCNGISEFTLREISKLIDVLDIENPKEIFFDKKVS